MSQFRVESDRLHAGLRCVVIMGSRGRRCGYVAVPESHPLFGVPYNQETPVLSGALAARLERPVGESMPAMLAALSGVAEARPDLVFEVHGGLTYSGGSYRGEPKQLAFELAKAEKYEADEALRGASLFFRRSYEAELAAAGKPSNYPVETTDRLWWFGFDCNHAWDQDDPKSLYFVENACFQLAEQLAAIV